MIGDPYEEANEEHEATGEANFSFLLLRGISFDHQDGIMTAKPKGI